MSRAGKDLASAIAVTIALLVLAVFALNVHVALGLLAAFTAGLSASLAVAASLAVGSERAGRRS